MVTNRILIFGASGQVGTALQRLVLPEDWQVYAPTRQECDFLTPSDIGKVVKNFTPDIIINAAAMTDLNLCEQYRDLAKEVNFHAVAHIAGQCDTLSAPLIQLSSDLVFDGQSEGQDITTGYDENAAMNPVNAYGETRLLGEEAARHGLSWHVILRTSFVFSGYSDNFLTQLLKKIDTQDEVCAANDRIACPLGAQGLAAGIVTIAKAILQGKGNGFGTFHLAGGQALTHFDFLQATMEAYAPYTTRRPTLRAVPYANTENTVALPEKLILNDDKIRKTYGITPPPWRNDLNAAVKEYAQTQQKK